MEVRRHEEIQVEYPLFKLNIPYLKWLGPEMF